MWTVFKYVVKVNILKILSLYVLHSLGFSFEDISKSFCFGDGMILIIE